jgi:hypothetical protein
MPSFQSKHEYLLKPVSKEQRRPYHVYLIDDTTSRRCKRLMDDAVNLRNPRSIPTKMVEQVPFGASHNVLTGGHAKIAS